MACPSHIPLSGESDDPCPVKCDTRLFAFPRSLYIHLIALITAVRSYGCNQTVWQGSIQSSFWFPILACTEQHPITQVHPGVPGDHSFGLVLPFHKDCIDSSNRLFLDEILLSLVLKIRGSPDSSNETPSRTMVARPLLERRISGIPCPENPAMMNCPDFPGTSPMCGMKSEL